jgi:hypothetical protein
MKTKKFHRTVLASAALGIAVTLGATGTAMATPTLQIVDSSGALVPGVPPLVPPASPTEETGDAGGTSRTLANGALAGAGLPSAAGGWSTAGAGFAADQSLAGKPLGTSGFHSSYLKLTEAANVTFQFMGKGDASLSNSFYLDINGDGLYNTNGVGTPGGERLFLGKTTNSCSVVGNTPSCSTTSGGFGAGQNQYTFALSAGNILFAFETGNGVLLENDGTGNGNPDPHTATGLPGYFLGVDPYLATKTYQTSGTAVYAGLSDLPNTGDHDFQDLGVRISVVPEPGGLALVLAAFGGLALTRRRSKQA